VICRQIDIRELALLISFISLGSSHTFPFPTPITEAARRFCVRRLTLRSIVSTYVFPHDALSYLPHSPIIQYSNQRLSDGFTFVAFPSIFVGRNSRRPSGGHRILPVLVIGFSPRSSDRTPRPKNRPTQTTSARNIFGCKGKKIKLTSLLINLVVAGC